MKVLMGKIQTRTTKFKSTHTLQPLALPQNIVSKLNIFSYQEVLFAVAHFAVLSIAMGL
jgi:hypothetical protein